MNQPPTPTSWCVACCRPRLTVGSTRKWMHTWATSMATGLLRKLPAKPTAVTASIPKPWTRHTGQLISVSLEIEQAPICRAWSPRAAADLPTSMT